MSSEPSFLKILVVGDGGVGKTAWARACKGAEFANKYSPTLGVEMHFLQYQAAATDQPVQVNLWDCAGQERYAGLADGYYLHADAAVLMFDVTSVASFKKVPLLHASLLKVCGPLLPIVLVGAKADCVDERRVRPKQVTFHRKRNLQYYEVSAKSAHNVRLPLDWLVSLCLRPPAPPPPAVAAQVPIPLQIEALRARVSGPDRARLEDALACIDAAFAADGDATELADSVSRLAMLFPNHS